METEPSNQQTIPQAFSSRIKMHQRIFAVMCLLLKTNTVQVDENILIKLMLDQEMNDSEKQKATKDLIEKVFHSSMIGVSLQSTLQTILGFAKAASEESKQLPYDLFNFALPEKEILNKGLTELYGEIPKERKNKIDLYPENRVFDKVDHDTFFP